jgi:hypothetical protein
LLGDPLEKRAESLLQSWARADGSFSPTGRTSGAARRGTNPIPDFEAIVSCQSISGTNATVTNVATGQFPASTRGNADIKARVTLPRPCIAPIVFVASPTGAWFAVTGS